MYNLFDAVSFKPKDIFKYKITTIFIENLNFIL